MKEKMIEIGKELKILRDKNGYTQEQVGCYLDLDQSMIAKIESGTRSIGISELSKLANLYGCEMNNLINCSITTPLALAYRATNVEKEDLEAIARIKKIVFNLRFMEKIISESNND